MKQRQVYNPVSQWTPIALLLLLSLVIAGCGAGGGAQPSATATAGIASSALQTASPTATAQAAAAVTPTSVATPTGALDPVPSQTAPGRQTEPAGPTSTAVAPETTPTAAPPIAPTATQAPTQAPMNTAAPEATLAPTPTVAPTATPTPAPEYYTVKEGDTLYEISREQGVALQALTSANGLTADTPIRVGQKLIIPRAGAQTGAQLPQIRHTLGVPKQRPLAELAPELVKYLQTRGGASSAAVYIPETDTLYTFRPRLRFEMASTVKIPFLVTQLAQQYEEDKNASTPGTDLLVPMITVSSNDAASALLEELGEDAVESELKERGVTETDINAEFWGLSTTTAPDMAKLMRSLYYGQGMNAELRDIAFGLLYGVIPEHRWGVPEGAPSGANVAFKGGWLPVEDGWLVHQVGYANQSPQPYIFALYNRGQLNQEYGEETLKRSAELLRNLR